MSAFLQKAYSNLESARMLLEDSSVKNPMPSAHTAYYAAFHLIKYILEHCLNVSSIEQSELVKTDVVGSHMILTNKVFDDIRVNHNSGYNDLQVLFNKVKMMRKKADYSPRMVERRQIEANYSDAKDFLQKISTIYSISA